MDCHQAREKSPLLIFFVQFIRSHYFLTHFLLLSTNFLRVFAFVGMSIVHVGMFVNRDVVLHIFQLIFA